MYSSMQSDSGVTSPVILDKKPTFYNPSSHSESEDGAEQPEANQSHMTLSTVVPTGNNDLEDFVFIENNQIEKQENKAVLKPG